VNRLLQAVKAEPPINYKKAPQRRPNPKHTQQQKEAASKTTRPDNQEKYNAT
jgi:hypothetical protein